MAKGQGRVSEAKSDIVKQLPRACQDETAAVEFIETQRWGNEAACPRCGNMDVYQMKDRKTGERSSRYLWRCRGCRQQFTVRIGTIFEDSPIPLRHWCYAFWAACASKKGVSALQIRRMTGLSYKSALFMMHRIRFAMSDSQESVSPLTGTVEADETYCGGKPRNRDPLPTSWPYPKRATGRGSKKAKVLAAVERGGSVRTAHVERPNKETLKAFLLANVSRSSLLMTDEYVVYKTLGHLFAGHETVRHSIGEYARGNVNTNSIESFFAILKRALYGTHHAVSRKHLHRYLSERAFVFNARHVDDGERTALAIKKANGKRLRYTDYVQ